MMIVIINKIIEIDLDDCDHHIHNLDMLFDFFSYASSSTLYSCERVGRWVIVLGCNLLA